jgi:hypothetical protein
MDDATAPVAPALDPLLEVLSDHRRRSVLRYLREVRGEVALATLVEAVRGDDDAPRDWIATELHHVHLPKLAAAGAVTYDPERRRVAFVGGGRVERLLDALADYESGTARGDAEPDGG